jgi:hypothetical protein
LKEVQADKPGSGQSCLDLNLNGPGSNIYDLRHNLPNQIRQGVFVMRVVDRKKVLPEVTIGLNKEETVTLASILSKSELEKEFCHDLLSKIGVVLKDDDFLEKKD